MHTHSYKLYVFTNFYSFIFLSFFLVAFFFCGFCFACSCVFVCVCVCHTVDAVYVMAHALHKILNEHCKDVEFSQCDVLQAGTIGPDLLRAIRDVSFIGMQGTQVSE